MYNGDIAEYEPVPYDEDPYMVAELKLAVNINVECFIPSPIRICGLDNMLADTYNDRVMDFDDDQIEEIYRSIVKDIEGKK